MRKARVFGGSLIGLPKSKNDIYEVYSTEEIQERKDVTLREKDSVRFFGNVSCFKIIGWVETPSDEYPEEKCFSQIYANDAEWLE